MQFLGVASVALTWAIIVVLLTRWPRIVSQSISRHAAANKEVHVPYAIALTIAVALMGLFIYSWFIPALQLPLAFSILFTAALACELVATWVPEVPGWQYTVHQLCSYGAAVLMPYMLVFVFASENVGLVGKAVALGSLLAMAASFLLYAFIKKLRQVYLWCQMSYIAAFHLSVLTAAYF